MQKRSSLCAMLLRAQEELDVIYDSIVCRFLSTSIPMDRSKWHCSAKEHVPFTRFYGMTVGIDDTTG